MTLKEESAALADYVRDIADRMILRDWVIFASCDPNAEPDDGLDGVRGQRNAAVECTFGRRAASVWVNPEYWQTGSAEDVRQTIVHELIHVHLHGGREVVLNALAGKYPSGTASTIGAIYDVQTEYGVDALADIIAPLMPLPERRT